VHLLGGELIVSALGFVARFDKISRSKSVQAVFTFLFCQFQSKILLLFCHSQAASIVHNYSNNALWRLFLPVGQTIRHGAYVACKRKNLHQQMFGGSPSHPSSLTIRAEHSLAKASDTEPERQYANVIASLQLLFP
jgi:hypothetical protein